MTINEPLENLCSVWASVLKKAEEHKEKCFGKTALECWKFFDEAHDFMYGKDGSGTGMEFDESIPLTFRMQLNKVSQLVQIFGPTLYFKNPYRQVNPRLPDLPVESLNLMGGPMVSQMMQGQVDMAAAGKRDTATLMQWYLNYTPHEMNLKWESRKAIDEALIKGRGLVWHEMYAPPESDVLMPRSYHVSVDDLLIDPDAESLEEAKWVARIRCMPTYEVEDRFRLKSGTLKEYGKYESAMQQSDVESSKHGIHYRKMGETHDLCVFYEVWSKCGMGQHLKLGGSDIIHSDVRKLAPMLEEFGDYVYMAICPKCPFLLNLPPEIMDLPETVVTEDGTSVQDEIKKRLSWPIPFYLDCGGNSWPFTELDFHPIVRSSWPQAHMKAGLGWLKFCSWVLSFLAGRVRHTSRLFIAVSEAADEEQYKAIEEGDDLTILRFKSLITKNVRDLVQFIETPQVGKDIWDIFTAAMQELDKATGLSELMFGTSGKQYRSSAEAQIKQEQINVRPDDMAELTEEWQSRIARKEGIMCRLFVGPESVAPTFGEQHDPMMMQFGPMTQLWKTLVYRPYDPLNPTAASAVFREYDYRIEAGSIRKPNRDRDQANMDQAMQSVFPSLFQYFTMTGDPTQVNALLAEWAKTRDIDKKLVMLNPPPPPPPMMPGQEQGGMPPEDPMAQQQQGLPAPEDPMMGGGMPPGMPPEMMVPMSADPMMAPQPFM